MGRLAPAEGVASSARRPRAKTQLIQVNMTTVPANVGRICHYSVPRT